MAQQFNVDETMGLYSDETIANHIPEGNPTKFGQKYKIWISSVILTLSYSWKCNDVHGIGRRGSFILDLISELSTNKPYGLYYNNLFTRPVLSIKIFKRNI